MVAEYGLMNILESTLLKIKLPSGVNNALCSENTDLYQTMVGRNIPFNEMNITVSVIIYIVRQLDYTQ